MLSCSFTLTVNMINADSTHMDGKDLKAFGGLSIVIDTNLLLMTLEETALEAYQFLENVTNCTTQIL